MAYVALRPLRRGGPVVSADRSGCWCADKRKPCSYHEGWGDAEDVCAVEIDGLSAELAAAYEDADRLAAIAKFVVRRGLARIDRGMEAAERELFAALAAHAALRAAGES